MNYLFGPVPSRRLGRSLGVDVIPPKTCSFDCIYCESGPTTHLSIKRECFADPAEVLRELDRFFLTYPNGADAVTFSSAGEPTLYSAIGALMAGIKTNHPECPLVVLTNGSLLSDPEVRKDLLMADRVVPSLDAVTTEIFRLINRPHPAAELSSIIEGIRAFRLDYKGEIHLEIMLAAGVNDSPAELRALAGEAERIGADRIELNTVVRPPARPGTKGLTSAQMNRAAEFFPCKRTSIIGVFNAQGNGTAEADLGTRILQTIERRPCTISELAASLGVPEKRLQRESRRLEEQKELTVRTFDGRQFLCPPK